MRIQFVIPCDPPKSTHQQNVRIFKKKNGKAFIGKSKTNKAARDRALLTELFREHAPASPLTGPLELFVRWTYPYRKAEPRKNRHAPKPCDKRPDCDNLAKGLQDVMTELGFWGDDGQIWALSFRKQWGVTPGIEVIITQTQ